MSEKEENTPIKYLQALKVDQYLKQTFMSANSSSDDECDSPEYVLKVTLVINVFRRLADSCPNLYGTTGSKSPWAWKICNKHPKNQHLEAEKIF